MGCKKATKRIGRLILKTVTPAITRAMAEMMQTIEDAGLNVPGSELMKLVVAAGKNAAVGYIRGSLLRATAEGMILGLRDGIVKLEEFGVDDSDEEQDPDLGPDD